MCHPPVVHLSLNDLFSAVTSSEEICFLGSWLEEEKEEAEAEAQAEVEVEVDAPAFMQKQALEIVRPISPEQCSATTLTRTQTIRTSLHRPRLLSRWHTFPFLYGDFVMMTRALDLFTFRHLNSARSS